MIDMRYKPRHLPQMSMPFEVALEELDNLGIDYEVIEIDPNELQPMQGVVFSDEVKSFDPNGMSPIWISIDNEVIDGHHRLLAALMNKTPIVCVKIELNGRDAARELNKIQDIYEYEQQRQLEEVVNQDVLNTFYNSDDNITDDEFLSSLEETEVIEPNKCKIFAFRQKPIMEKSAIGNFFMLDPIDGYDKYEIEFDNLLDTNDLNVDVSSQHPVDALANSWFPNVDFENMSEPYKYSPQELKNKAIVDRAKKMGYDGIKYGDSILQGLK